MSSWVADGDDGGDDDKDEERGKRAMTKDTQPAEQRFHIYESSRQAHARILCDASVISNMMNVVVCARNTYASCVIQSSELAGCDTRANSQLAG